MKKYFCIGVLSTMITFVIIILLILLLCPIRFKPVYFVDPIFAAKYKEKAVILSPQEQHTMGKLVDQGILISPQEYTGNLGDYYNTLITVMGIVLGLSTFIGYIIVKENSEKVITEEVDKEMKRFFSDSKTFDNRLSGFINGHIDYIPSMDDLVELEDRLNERIVKLEQESEDSVNHGEIISTED